MKKKIKDLTREEIDKICKKQPSCYECPLCLNGEYTICNFMFEEIEIDESNTNEH